MSEDLVDTWPDWKLDTLSLRERSIRRERGEMLPKPTQQAKQLSDALSELKRLREENEAHKQALKEIYTAVDPVGNELRACEMKDLVINCIQSGIDAFQERDDARARVTELEAAHLRCFNDLNLCAGKLIDAEAQLAAEAQSCEELIAGRLIALARIDHLELRVCEVVDERDALVIRLATSEAVAIVARGWDNPLVARVPAVDRSIEEVLANAQLISAAPEMLTALNALMAGFVDGSIRFTKKRQSDSDPHHPANTLMCDAIAKAEGR